MDRLIVNYVRQPLDPILDREIREFPLGTSVREIIEAMDGPGPGEATSSGDTTPSCPRTQDYVVNINGLILSESADLANCRPTGTVVICATPQGGGGKDVLRVVAMIAVMVVAYIYAPPAGAWLSASMGGAISASAGAAIAGAGIMMAGSLLVNALLPANIADATGGTTSDYSQSSTYGWSVSGNTDAEGVAWPILYGTHRITPPVIGKYVEVVGDKQYLNILYAVADHAIDAIDETSIEINGNPVAAETDDLAWDVRRGDVDQAVIQYFNDTRFSKSVGSKLGVTWTTVVTDGIAVEGLGIALTLPKGLYYAADDGSLAEQSVDLDIEYRISGAGDWIPVTAYNTATMSVTQDRWSGGYWSRLVAWETQIVTNEWVDIEPGSLDPFAHLAGDPYSPPAGYSPRYEDNSWGRRPVYEWRWLTDSLTVRTPGTLALDHVQITGNQTAALRRVWYADRLTAGAYEIRVRFHDGIAPPDGTRYANDVYLDYLEEIIYDDFAYPGTALFALRALATDKLSGSMPAVTLIATRATVPVWNGSEYVDSPADNPAWMAWDALHNGDYAGGLSYDRLRYADFLSWATYCDEKGYSCNLYGDSTTNLRKVLDMIGMLGEGTVAQLGADFTCYVDQEVEYPVQSFIFNAGNTMRESYAEEYLAMDDRANSVEVTFWDAANSHKRTTIEIPAADFDETTQEIKKTQLSLLGCTSRTEAIKHGYRALNRNRYLTRTASWDASIDSLGCLPWDPVVPPIGQDGRVVSGTANSVALDREVLLQPGHTYLIRIKNASNDTVEEKTVAAVIEETVTEELTVTANWTHVPALHELYVFYEEGQDRGLMRVVRITRKNDFTRRITAIEYNALACDDSGAIDAPESSATLVSTDHLRAEEIWKGISDTAVQLSWTGFALRWRVWHRRSDVAQWTYAGETSQPSMTLSGLDYGMEYTFCVSHTANPADGEIVTLTPTGTLLATPSPVTDVVVADAGVEVGIGGAVTCNVCVSWTDRPADERVVDYSVIYKEI